MNTYLYWVVIKRKKRCYRVRAKTRNGRIVFASTEAYTTKSAAIRNAALFGAPRRELQASNPGTICKSFAA